MNHDENRHGKGVLELEELRALEPVGASGKPRHRFRSTNTEETKEYMPQ